MTVTSNLTNLTLAEAADASLWDDVGGGQGSGQSSDLPIEGLETRARRIDNTTTGFGFDNQSGVDISAAGTHVGFWVNVLQPGQIGATQGLEFSLSDSGTNCQSGNWDGHQFTAASYPSTGGWQRVWVDPTRTRDAGDGTLALTGVRNYGCEFDMGNVGGNAQNCHLDRIDYTATGLAITAGSVGTPTTFADAITVDETNAYGVIDEDFLNGPINIGNGVATVFNDTNFAFKAGNQPLAAADWVTITVDISNVSADIDWGTWFLDGIGLIVTGTSGDFNMGTGVWVNAPAITLNTAVTWAGKLALSDTLDANGADLAGTVFEESSGTSAVIWDVATNPGGAGGELDDTTFLSAGTGHGLELGTTSPTTIDLNDVTFTGYAASDGSTGDEAIWVRRTSGTVTINVVGGSSPSVRTDGATVVVVLNPVTTLITVQDVTTGSAIQDARVLVTTAAGGSLPFEDAVTITRSGSTATVSHTGHGLSTGDKVLIEDATQPEYNGIKTITVTGVNSYTYTVSGTPVTPATGTILSTAVIIDGLTDVNGQISDTRSYASNQPVSGRARKSSASPFYKTGPIAGTVDSGAGLSVTVQMIPDE